MKLWTLLSQWYVGGDVSGDHIGAQREEPVSGLRPDTRTSGRAMREARPGTGSFSLRRTRVETEGSFHDGG